MRPGTPVHFSDVTVLPVEQVSLHMEMGIAGAWFSAAKQPYALIVRDAGGIRAVDIDTAVSLDQLRESIPGLGALLDTM